MAHAGVRFLDLISRQRGGLLLDLARGVLLLLSLPYLLAVSARNAYYDLIKRFEERTGCAVIINTSFNVRGEPIVCTPHDAFLCFMRTHMDVLVLDRFYMEKEDQTPLEEDVDWRDLFELD